MQKHGNYLRPDFMKEWCNILSSAFIIFSALHFTIFWSPFVWNKMAAVPCDIFHSEFLIFQSIIQFQKGFCVRASMRVTHEHEVHVTSVYACVCMCPLVWSVSVLSAPGVSVYPEGFDDCACFAFRDTEQTAFQPLQSHSNACHLFSSLSVRHHKSFYSTSVALTKAFFSIPKH